MTHLKGWHHYLPDWWNQKLGTFAGYSILIRPHVQLVATFYLLGLSDIAMGPFHSIYAGAFLVKGLLEKSNYTLAFGLCLLHPQDWSFQSPFKLFRDSPIRVEWDSNSWMWAKGSFFVYFLPFKLAFPLPISSSHSTSAIIQCLYFPSLPVYNSPPPTLFAKSFFPSLMPSLIYSHGLIASSFVFT